MQETTDELNIKGIRTVRGTKISLNTVTGMLHNRRYIGEYQYRDVIVPNGIPAIVPAKLFEQVQERAIHKKSTAITSAEVHAKAERVRRKRLGRNGLKKL